MVKSTEEIEQFGWHRWGMPNIEHGWHCYYQNLFQRGPRERSRKSDHFFAAKSCSLKILLHSLSNLFTISITFIRNIQTYGEQTQITHTIYDMPESAAIDSTSTKINFYTTETKRKKNCKILYYMCILKEANFCTLFLWNIHLFTSLSFDSNSLWSTWGIEDCFFFSLVSFVPFTINLYIHSKQ